MRNLRKTAVFAAWSSFMLVLMLTACDEKADNPPPSPTGDEAALSQETVAWDHSSQFLNISSENAWTITVAYPVPAAEPNWCTPEKTYGVGNDIVRISYTNNISTETRIAEIVVDFVNGNPIKLELTQQGKPEGPDDPNDPDDPEVVQKYDWLELPEIAVNSERLYIAHFAPVDGREKRNYSMLYDTKQKIAYWVAYPMHACYLNGSGRSSWSYDPSVGKQYQASGYQSGYSKGHQIPSGDRHTTSSLLNKQTFYYTNITPQIQDFNGAIWGNLENKIRAWTVPDTLYVVTGAVLQTVGGNETVKYESENHVPIPNYYYKVLLKHKGAGYTAIGFWFEHKKYSNNTITPAYAKSVDEIEALTGWNFFANLSAEEQACFEGSYNASDWDL